MTGEVIETNKTNRITELFGLPKSGKSTFYREFLRKNKEYEGINFKEVSLSGKLLYFFKFILKNPIKTIYLFYKLNTNWIKLNELKVKDYFKIFKMRNSYLLAALSKYELVKKNPRPIIVDEFLLQSMFMIKQTKSSEEELIKITKNLLKSGKIILIEEKPNVIHKRWENIKNPEVKLNPKYKITWFKNSEFNFDIIRQLLLNNRI